MKKIVFAFSVFAALMMSACLPETRNEMLGIPENAILLSSERYAGHGDKTAVNGTDAFWVNGDKVYLNSIEYEVTVSGGKAYVSVSASDAMRSGELYGYYGLTSTTPSEGKVNVTVPSEYTSSFSGTRQVIALPMVAYKPASVDNVDSIKFRHVTAAVKVSVRNNTGASVYLDSVVVSNSTYQLSGTISELNVSNISNLTVAANNAGVAEADKRVKVAFAYKNVSISNGNIKDVQVPILPVGEDASLTISVYTHQLVDRTGMPKVNYDYIFSHTASIPAALNRNEMLTAQVDIKPQTDDANNHITEVDHSLFTINASGDQVRFSMGNLRYNLGDSKWYFYEVQYGRTATNDNISTDYVSSDTKPSSSRFIDLFGWGMSGISGSATHYQPWYRSYSNNDFRSDVGNSTNLPSNLDWGNNAIYNGGNETGQWKTMTKDEWTYLMGTRKGNANKRGRGTVENIPGVLLLPDDFIDPQTNSANGGTFVSGFANFDQNKYSSEGWTAMEEAGAVFLPACGYRGGTSLSYLNTYVDYWTSSSSSSNGNAHIFKNEGTAYTVAEGKARQYGHPVRLVQNKQN